MRSGRARAPKGGRAQKVKEIRADGLFCHCHLQTDESLQTDNESKRDRSAVVFRLVYEGTSQTRPKPPAYPEGLAERSVLAQPPSRVDQSNSERFGIRRDGGRFLAHHAEDEHVVHGLGGEKPAALSAVGDHV